MSLEEHKELRTPQSISRPAVGDLQRERPLLSLREVSKSYSNGTLALGNISLDVCEGEFVSLLGPSGCGKSTALRIIASLAKPSTGVVEWPEAATKRAKRPLGTVSYVFQEATLMPWATAFDNVWLPLRLGGQSRRVARSRVMNALDDVGLANFAHAYPRELSGGMKMRVSIARAFVTRPKLLLMDEPFAALDEITRFKLNDDVIRLKQEFGVTVIFVTHSVFESVYLSSRILVMATHPGRVVAEIAVDPPGCRDERFRTSVEYAALCRTVSSALRDAIASGSQEDPHG